MLSVKMVCTLKGAIYVQNVAENVLERGRAQIRSKLDNT